MEMLQGVWKQHLRPRAVVGYGVKVFLPSPPNYVTRSPGVYTVYSSRVSYKQNIMPKPNSINQVKSYGTEHEKLLFICFNMQWIVAGYHMNNSLCQSLILLIRLGLIALKMKS